MITIHFCDEKLCTSAIILLNRQTDRQTNRHDRERLVQTKRQNIRIFLTVLLLKLKLLIIIIQIKVYLSILLFP